MSLRLPLSTPCLISLTEWTVLDHTGFKDLFCGQKITPTIGREGVSILRSQTGPQEISSNFAHANVKDLAPHFSQRSLEGID